MRFVESGVSMVGVHAMPRCCAVFTCVLTADEARRSLTATLSRAVLARDRE